ncbi:hypothetical protein [Treponema primitia]|uniref:hypothetical protein n=1 Tax=Treponema primitia TaxID=88058 RepID=UPI0002554D28|nr:hypothetical protein [Treponema primitia]
MTCSKVPGTILEPAERKKYLLEYVFNEYKTEIERKYLIENKAIGYYTVLGISFAGFVASLIYIASDFIIKPTVLGFLNAASVITSIIYIFFMTFIVFFLKRAFRPKDTEHYKIKEFWEKLQEADDILVYDSIYKNLKKCLKFNRKENKKIVKYLKLTDFFMIHLIIFNIFLTAVIVFSIFLEKGIIHVEY